MKNNRRDFIKKSAALAALSITGLNACTKVKKSGSNENNKLVEWPVIEGPNTPKLCFGGARDADTMRQLKQIGVDYALAGGGPIPWKEEGLRTIIDRYKAEGLTVINLMIGDINNIIYGREGRDAEITKVQESLVAAGAVGLPVVEYNFYADRLMESYYVKDGRGGSGILAVDYTPVKDLQANPEIGTYTSEQLWDNLTYFLKAVIPVAEKAGVRMALHPNDPPVPISHGSAQIMATLKDWKRLIEIVDSPSNGITYDCGVTREMGEDPVEVLHYFGTRDRINHMHFRNVTVQEPHTKYEEVFFDVGQVNLFAVMREAFSVGYKLGLFPEHTRILDYDKEHPRGTPSSLGSGGYTGTVFNVAYTRAMMQAVLSM